METTQKTTIETTYEQPAFCQLFTGADQVTRYGKHIATTGAIETAETFSCYWFLDVICSYQIYRKFQNEDFQVWELKRNTFNGDEFTVTATDGNCNVLATQKIPFSDYQENYLKMYFIDGTILLPTEY